MAARRYGEKFAQALDQTEESALQYRHTEYSLQIQFKVFYHIVSGLESLTDERSADIIFP
jgi:hypothetical protein